MTSSPPIASVNGDAPPLAPDSFRAQRRLHDYPGLAQSFPTRLLLGVLFALVLGGFFVGVRVFRHLRATATVMHAGATVDYEYSGLNWLVGGQQIVTYSSPLAGFRTFMQANTTRDIQVSFKALPELLSVKVLELSGPDEASDSSLADLAPLKQLETLNLNRNGPDPRTGTVPKRYSDAALSHVGKLKSLRSLWLANNDITDVGLPAIEGLDQLEELDLDWTLVTDKSVPSLSRLKSLKVLRLGGTKVSPEACQQLMAKIPGLMISTEVPPDNPLRE